MHFQVKEDKHVIITLMLERQYQDLFNRQRALHYPKHANHRDAHLTLLHRLPATPDTLAELEAYARRPAIKLHVTGVEDTGYGVAYTVVSEELQQLHRTMRMAWEAKLVARDLQPLWPHITIQHGATAFKAARLAETLRADFRPFAMKGTGLCTWYYQRRSWEVAGIYPFSG